MKKLKIFLKKILIVKRPDLYKKIYNSGLFLCLKLKVKQRKVG